MRKSAFVPLSLIGVAVLAGYLNYAATDDVQLVAGALFAGALAAGLWRPRLAPLSVLLLWAAVPVSTLLAEATHHDAGLLRAHPLYETLAALLPTAIGAVLGVAARRFRPADSRGQAETRQ